MTNNILQSILSRRGHFLLESGYHTDLWFTLDALFVSPQEMAHEVEALSELLRPYEISAVCGPLLGGAFLAHALAAHMKLRFYFTQQSQVETDGSLFATQYLLPAELRRRASQERIAIVDDCISAGSSVRATAAALTAAQASVVVVGTILLLGNEAVEYFSSRGVPVLALDRQEFKLWSPDECPLCLSEMPLENPST